MSSNKRIFSGAYDFIKTDSGLVKAEASGKPNINIDREHTFVTHAFDPDLKDYQRRVFPLLDMIPSQETLGYPYVWNEQDNIPSNTEAVDPQKGVGEGIGKDANYKKKTLNTDYKRSNWKQALPRMYMTGIQYSWFDTQMQKRYGSYMQDLLAKDLNDMKVDYNRTIANDFWNGDSPSLDDTSNFKYMGILNQITDKDDTVPAGTRIAQVIQTKIAKAQAQIKYLGAPNVICMNPITFDILCQEEEKNANGLYHRSITTEIIPGIEVPAINTQVGLIPIHLTPFIKVEGTKHKIVALNTNMIKRIWLFSPTPMLFVTQDANNPINNPALMTDKNLMNIDTYILFGTQTPSHFIITKDTAGE